MTKPVVLLLETESISRHALAEYLRECGYKVVEAVNTDEVSDYLNGGVHTDVALLDVRAQGQRNAFEIKRWLASNRPETDVIMVGSIESAAEKAGALCDDGPTLLRPYDHSRVIDLIKQLRAKRCP